MLAEAKREAERVVKEARDQQARLISDEEVYKQAERAAEEIIEDARETERQIRLGAEDYADEILSTLEVNLEKFLAAVRRGRDRLADARKSRPRSARAASGSRRAVAGDARAARAARDGAAFERRSGLCASPARLGQPHGASSASSSRPSCARSRCRAGSLDAEEVIGAAVWVEPGQWRVPLATTLRELGPMTRVFGSRLPVALWSRLRMDSRHPSRPAHWYLAMMGVAPEWQGRGLGSALMRPGLEEIDAARLPAYLETSTPAPALFMSETDSPSPAS